MLNTRANDTFGTPALFMLTEYCITSNMSWDNRSSDFRANWTNSDGSTDSAIKKFLLGNAGGDYPGTSYESSVYDDCFDTKEQCAMLSTYNGELSDDDEINILYSHSNTYTSYGCPLTGEKLFLLSAKEVTNQEYGFNNSLNVTNTLSDSYNGLPNDINRMAKFSTANTTCNYWWLRSGCSRTEGNLEASLVSRDGFIDSNNSTGKLFYSGVRFALNIPLSKILFTSDSSCIPSHNFIPIMSNNSPSHLTRTTIVYSSSSVATISPEPTETATLSGQLIYLLDNTLSPTPIKKNVSYGAGAKLTIIDDTRNDFAVNKDIIRSIQGASVSIGYSGACTGSNEYISAIIKDTYGNPLYHARLKAVAENSSGTVSMYIPTDIVCGEYTIVVYNEVERGAYNTNYAGYDTLVLVVCDEEEKPTVTNVYKNAAGTKFKFTASDDWDLYQVTNPGGGHLRHLANTNVTTNMECGNQSYLLVQDLAGNNTSINTKEVLIDRTPPNISITYANGKYNLTISDNESGVWKITNSDGSTIYHDYSTSDSSATT